MGRKLLGASDKYERADSESKPLYQSWIDAMTLRWKASERYLNGLATESLPKEHAIRILVKDDIAMLMKELTRLGLELMLRNFNSPNLQL